MNNIPRIKRSTIKSRGPKRRSSEPIAICLVYLKFHSTALVDHLREACGNTNTAYLKKYVLKDMINEKAIKETRSGRTSFYMLTKNGQKWAEDIYNHALKKDVQARVDYPSLCNDNFINGLR